MSTDTTGQPMDFLATAILREWPDALAFRREWETFEGSVPFMCACARLGSRIGALSWEHALLHSLDDLLSTARSRVSERLLSKNVGDGTTVLDHWRGSGERELNETEHAIVAGYAEEMALFDRWMDGRLAQIGDWPKRVSVAATRRLRVAMPTTVHGPKGFATLELTGDHIVGLKKLSEEAVRDGLSTAPANRIEAELGVGLAYRSMGCVEPSAIFWASSPRAAYLLISAISNAVVAVMSSEQEMSDLAMLLALSNYAGVIPPAALSQAADLVRATVVEGVEGDTILDPLDRWWGGPYSQDAQWAERTMSNDTASLIYQLAVQPVDRQLERLIEPFVVDQIEVEESEAWWGLDPWVTRADCRGGSAYFRALNVVGAPVLDRWGGLDQVDRNAGWWWAFRGFAVLCERPVRLERDGSGRVHSDTGMAVEWSDGWGIHAWHGTSVPGDLITSGWDVQRVFRERNVELRRCAIERMGWPEFVAALGLRLIAEAEDPGNPGFVLSLFDELVSVFEEPVRVLLCTNASVERDGTRRRYGLTVPADIDDPVSAAAWTFGLDADQYRQLAAAS